MAPPGACASRPSRCCLLAGFLLGPVFGVLNPAESFGEVYKPAIALAVAIILFEGGLTLNFSEIRETGKAVQRIVLIGGPLVWLFSSLAAHFAAGLSWPTSIVIGAVLVVTGPTVIMPLLRQAQLRRRPASLLRWEAIVNDPIGALFAVFAFEVYLVMHGTHDGWTLVGLAALAFAIGTVGAYLVARGLAYVFLRGWIAEYLKAPVLFATVLIAYAISDAVLEESGLLTVTVMGITLANTRLSSLTEMRRFKETVTVLLVSGLFVMLTASLSMAQLTGLEWGAFVFAAIVLFVARPVAIFLATIGAGLDWKERALVAWIAPRGIVAVAVAGLFGQALVENGVPDGAELTAISFVIVAATIVLHGFSLGPLASWLGLKTAARPGVLFVGGSAWSIAFAEKLQELDTPVMIADDNWSRIKDARLKDIPVHYGQILSEAAHHTVEFNRFSHLIAATDNDAYNSLVCTEFAPELGRGNVFQVGKLRDGTERKALSFTIGGQSLFDPPRDYGELRRAIWRGDTFTSTLLTEKFDYDRFRETRPEGTAVLMWIDEGGDIVVPGGESEDVPEVGDRVISFGPKLDNDLTVTGKESVAERAHVREKADAKAHTKSDAKHHHAEGQVARGRDDEEGRAGRRAGEAGDEDRRAGGRVNGSA